ncbi:MAG: hypothetical protein KatS3mg105_3205 [Gemmatales bacterium]|nr:MAG: hypothetical protein KatS3mg105_3205 [Gemmatales bacterium]
MRQPTWAFALLALAGLCLPAPVRACNVPVFRYALERWPPDPYAFTVFYHEKIPEDVRAMIAALEKSSAKDGRANIVVHWVDVAQDGHSPAHQWWREQKDVRIPCLVVHSPPRSGVATMVWSGVPTTATIQKLVDSPARRELSRRLLSGESAVWLLLESGNKVEDDAAFQLLTEQLARLEKQIELPKGETEPHTGLLVPPGPDQGAELLSKIPLKIDFSVLRVSRQDPAERFFVRMLLAVNPKLEQATAPIVYPVFGQGRALHAFQGNELTPPGIEEAARFLCGACSCSVKASHPGFDLLLRADWTAVVGGKIQPAQANELRIGEKVALPNRAENRRQPSVPPRNESARHEVSPTLLVAISVVGVYAALAGVVIARRRHWF